MKGELNLNLSKCLVMDNYHNASPITESIFAHCDPLKETSSDIEKELGDEVNRKILLLSTNNVNTIEDFLITNEEEKLKHIIIDNVAERPEFVKEVFTNEEKFPYLKKIYDSKADGYNYHLKIFEIDYNQFNELRN